MTTSNEKKLQEELKESAHRIWLAGLGALATAESEGSKIFGKLVERGRDFEAEGKEKFEQGKKKAEEAWDNVTETLDEKVTAALHRIGVPTREEIHRLTAKVEELTAKIEQLKGEDKKVAAKAKKADA